ncbi:spore coat protein [Pelosinus sp. UFO1]|uniref:spore coat protein n=1 Tax=Pelosinus sp. UFO1 TaxID=484770 RepID=UPI0004D0E37C|nr:spore coat protein [Pelosinus sp. UFO1]AIF53098.1 Coat F domain protein [Pelosinus sp. UFO1]
MDNPKKSSPISRNRLSDRDMLLDLMITEKHLSRLYDQGVLESTSPMISNTFERLQASSHDNARTIFTAMQQRGWYNPERTGRTERLSRGTQKQSNEFFDTTADSKYAVSSGTRKFGRHLPREQRSGKSGIFSNQRPETNSEDWQYRS